MSKFTRSNKTIIYGLFFLSIVFAQPLRQVRPEVLGMSSDRLEKLTHHMETLCSKQSTFRGCNPCHASWKGCLL